MIDAVLIKNVSSQSITLNGLSGRSLPSTDLRPFVFQNLDPHPDNSIVNMSAQILPNESILIPTKLKITQNDVFLDDFSYPQTSAALFKTLGVGSFTGNTSAHALPHMREYLYGPATVITGLVANGQRIIFANKSANYLNLTLAGKSGSCPYLLAERRGRWETFGKVLHRSSSKEREDSQTVVYLEYVDHFRLEEREREFAHIDLVSLVHTLKDGTFVEVKPSDPRLASRDEKYVDLSWGDQLDLLFEKPASLSVADIVKSPHGERLL